LKLCSWVDDLKISDEFDNGQVMIINTRVIDPLTAKYAHMSCLHNKVHIYEWILSKLCTCIIDKKISLKFENGNDMIVGSGVIAP